MEDLKPLIYQAGLLNTAMPTQMTLFLLETALHLKMMTNIMSSVLIRPVTGSCLVKDLTYLIHMDVLVRLEVTTSI